MRLFFLFLLLVAAGCPGVKSEPAPQRAAASSTAPQGTSGVAGARVSKIVFIDKENACECTQKAIDASWSALQTSLQGASVAVERIHMDTQEAFAAGYIEKRPMVAVPGVYFLGAEGGVLELLQGELDPAKIREVLGR